METHRRRKAAVDLHMAVLAQAKEVHQANQTMVDHLLAITTVLHLRLQKVTQVRRRHIAQASQTMVRHLTISTMHLQ